MAEEAPKDDVEELMRMLGVDPTHPPAPPPKAAPASAATQQEMDQIIKEVKSGKPPPLPPEARKPDYEVLAPATGKLESSIDLLRDVDLHVRIELGRTKLFVQDVLKLAPGSVVELDRLTGDPLDVYVNGRLVARGEVLVINDNFAIRITEVINSAKLPEK